MKYEYMIDNSGRYVVPWARTSEEKSERDKLFVELFGSRPIVVSPDFWDHLMGKYEVKILEVENK